jgi:organic radical activating enzyme
MLQSPKNCYIVVMNKIERINMKYFSMNANFTDYPDSSKICISVFLPGCDLNCDDCHNESIKDHDYHDESYEYAEDYHGMVNSIISYAIRNRTNNIAIMGGDPFHKSNKHITENVSKLLINCNYNVMIYTGYSIHKVKSFDLDFTYLKCGMYDKNLKQESKLTDTQFILASKNQEIYNSEYVLVSKDGVYNYK